LTSDAILLFERKPLWQVAETILLGPVPTDNTAKLRDWISALIQKLPDCRILAGGEVSGLPYQMFSRAGFSIFTISQITPEALDGIFQDVRQLEDGIPLSLLPEAPQETDTPGVYFLDLAALQNEKPEITSKMALLPFLRETPFLELRLRCGHVPPWLKEQYQVDARTDRGQTLAVITKRDCERS
jgi:Iron only nitrogenase protein AnfO (AnfO_nitrog).